MPDQARALGEARHQGARRNGKQRREFRARAHARETDSATLWPPAAIASQAAVTLWRPVAIASRATAMPPRTMSRSCTFSTPTSASG
jgi:hypothetical protein